MFGCSVVIQRLHRSMDFCRTEFKVVSFISMYENCIVGYRSLLYNGRNNMQAWGLIVLLISKAAGHLNVEEMEEDKAAGVLHR